MGTTRPKRDLIQSLLAQLAQAIFDISLQEIFIALIQLLFGHDLGVSLVRIFGIACRCGLFAVGMGPRIFRSLPYYNWDLSLTKAMKFKERLTTQFRAEFFNILNHPNISNPFGGPGGGNSFTDPSGAAGASFGFRP